MKTIGISFSKPQNYPDPFYALGEKRPVYEELIGHLQEKGFNVFVVTTKAYEADGIFRSYWEYKNGKFETLYKRLKVDLVYDRSAGLLFPRTDDNLRVADERRFKVVCWDKWKAYAEFGKYMPKSLWVGKSKNVVNVLGRIPGEYIVVKPYNGLKGKDIYIGPKSKVLDFDFMSDEAIYIAQEFVETKSGVAKVVKGRHDLRTVIINGKIVWAHVRAPIKGGFKANVAKGGHLKEISVNSLPSSITGVVREVAPRISEKYDNPIYSLDFGVGKNGVSYIFEINDQIGFPKPDMEAKDKFLDELVENLASKL